VRLSPQGVPIALCSLLLVAAVADAQSTPSIRASAREERRPAYPALSPLRLWDTTRWLDVQAAAGDHGRLDAIEYRAKYDDSGDARGVSGSVPVDAEQIGGRITVTCASRPDYDRPLRVRLRARTAGKQSDWIEVGFPPEPEAPPAANLPLSVEPAASARKTEPLGTVQVTVGDETTIEKAKEALQRKALEVGGDAAVGFRLVESGDEGVTFAADAVRYIVAPTPGNTRREEVGGSSDQVLGEIAMPEQRR
jgi:hypothetical protein